jgi:DNA modification methylase
MLTNQPKLMIEDVCLDQLSPYPHRARLHGPEKLRMLVKSIQEIGFTHPILIDGANMILSGHLRVEAMQALGYKTIQAVRLAHLSPDQKVALVLNANRLPERGKWDEDTLREELQILLDAACSVDLEITGFEIPEIDRLVISGEAGDEIEPVSYEPPAKPVTRPGDLWVCGDHVLLCANSLEAVSWDTLMAGERAQACFTDPPYNVRVRGHVSSKPHAEFAMASGEMSRGAFTDFLQRGLAEMARVSTRSALHYVCMDHRHLRELFAAADRVYHEQLNLIVWAKPNGGMGSFYRSRHELIALFKTGPEPHTNQVQLGRFGRNRTNVWTYEGANMFRKGRDRDLADHPTVKPVAMVADALLDCTHPGDLVIDGFGGSGTLMLAAERTGRRARLIELDPGYCDVTVRRWEEMTGKTAHRRSASQGPLLLPAPEVEDAP